MIHAIKEFEDGAISLMKFKDVDSMEEGFVEIEEQDYKDILAGAENNPHGKYEDGKWKSETGQEKLDREAISNARNNQVKNIKEKDADDEFIARYDRLKADGKIT